MSDALLMWYIFLGDSVKDSIAEQRMSKIQYGALIAQAAFAVTLLSLRPAVAQVGVNRALDSAGASNIFVTGAVVDIVDKAKAEHRLGRLEARLARDTQRSDSAAIERDVYRIDKVKFRIAVDDWLIRKNLYDCAGYYPSVRLDPMSCAAIAQARGWSSPWDRSLSPVPMSTPVRINIANAQPTGADVTYAINGIPHQAAAGSRKDLDVTPNSYITYDSGGSLGQHRYRITPGRYEFRSTADGLALYKLLNVR